MYPTGLSRGCPPASQDAVVSRHHEPSQMPTRVSTNHNSARVLRGDAEAWLDMSPASLSPRDGHAADDRAQRPSGNGIGMTVRPEATANCVVSPSEYVRRHTRAPESKESSDVIRARPTEKEHRSLNVVLCAAICAQAPETRTPFNVAAPADRAVT